MVNRDLASGVLLALAVALFTLFCCQRAMNRPCSMLLHKPLGGVLMRRRDVASCARLPRIFRTGREIWHICILYSPILFEGKYRRPNSTVIEQDGSHNDDPESSKH